MLENDIRVGLRGDSCILSVWDSMSDKEKEEFLKIETENDE